MAGAAPQEDCIPQEKRAKMAEFVTRIGELNTRITGEKDANELFRNTIREKIQNLQAKIQEIAPKMKELNDRITISSQTIAGLTKERDECKKQLQKLQRQLEYSNREREQAIANVQRITQELNESKGQHEGSQQQLIDAQRKLQECETNAARCQQQINELMASIDQIDAAIGQNNASIDELHKTANDTYTELAASLDSIQQDLDFAGSGNYEFTGVNPSLPLGQFRATQSFRENSNPNPLLQTRRPSGASVGGPASRVLSTSSSTSPDVSDDESGSGAQFALPSTMDRPSATGGVDFPELSRGSQTRQEQRIIARKNQQSSADTADYFGALNNPTRGGRKTKRIKKGKKGTRKEKKTRKGKKTQQKGGFNANYNNLATRVKYNNPVKKKTRKSSSNKSTKATTTRSSSSSK
jgi:uncharacterized coiled-coil DUF342 family protein